MKLKLVLLGLLCVSCVGEHNPVERKPLDENLILVAKTPTGDEVYAFEYKGVTYLLVDGFESTAICKAQ